MRPVPYFHPIKVLGAAKKGVLSLTSTVHVPPPGRWISTACSGLALSYPPENEKKFSLEIRAFSQYDVF